jgi:hypothetical protein
MAPKSLNAYHRPVVGGIKAQVPGSCTVGFNAKIGSNYYFVTNTHCSSSPGQTDGGIAYQPNSPSAIGYEYFDLPFFSCGAPSQCRYSDASLYRYYGSITNDHQIALPNPPSIGSTMWDPNLPKWVNSEGPYPPMYTYTARTGIGTGFMVGIIIETCEDKTSGSWLLLCQYRSLMPRPC